MCVFFFTVSFVSSLLLVLSPLLLYSISLSSECPRLGKYTKHLVSYVPNLPVSTIPHPDALVQEQDHSQECNNSLRRDLTAAHDELSSVKASNATLEDTMALRLTDIRQLEQEKSLAASTIRDLTSRTDTLEQQLAESKDEVRQVLLTTSCVLTSSMFRLLLPGACSVLLLLPFY